MQNKKKALLIGDIENAIYHSLKGFDIVFKNILVDFEVDVTLDYNMFKFENLNKYDLCISFTDCWNKKLNKNLIAGLVTFVVNGKGLLLVHNGVSLQSNYELLKLIGAKFIGHPEQRILTYKPTSSNHIIINGINSFQVKEEPYQFIMDELIETEVLLNYEYEGKKYAAGWAHNYGLGRVVCLSPGHNLDTLKVNEYQKLIYHSSKWLVGLI